MHKFQRRQFLRHLTATVGGFTVAGCGGGNSEAEAAASSSLDTALADSTSPSIPGPAAYITPDPGVTPDPTPAPTGAMQFSLASPSSSTAAPFCIGYAFKKGDVSAGKGVVGSIASLQVTPKNYWPDGSLKFAVVAGHAALSAGNSSTVILSTGTPSAGTKLTTADLKATGVVASTGCGSFGTVTWAATDWDTPFQNWISGPEMSSWIYRKPVGSDRHLVAWLEVRLFKGGAVEVLPWIENGYLMVAGPTNKSATYTFALGGTQRFSLAIDLSNHCRTPLLSGGNFAYWLGTDPQITPKHDTAYLQSTALVPAYRASVAPNAPAVAALVTTFEPLQQGNQSPAMGSGGYHPSIGLLPEWDVLYLASSSPRAYAGVITNAYGSGRYGTHFRDETTNRPLRFSSFPNLVIGGGASVVGSGASSKNSYTPDASGTVPPAYNSTHHPSMGYLAYLVSGRWYFMEEVQFVATVNFLKNTDTNRQFAGGVLLTQAGANTTRGAAWSLRTLAQAASATPDDDGSLRGEFLASLKANVDYYHGVYVAQANNNLGVVWPYADYDTAGVFKASTWQQHFFTAAIGYALALEPALNGGLGKLSAFFNWKAKHAIGMLGGTTSTDYLYRDAAEYTFAAAPTDTPDWIGGTGPWYPNWGAVYAATLGTPNPGSAGDLRGGYFPDATSYWGNLQPAIAYAIQHGVPGAAESYRRMTSAGNWPQIESNFNSDSVWSVRPIAEV